MGNTIPGTITKLLTLIPILVAIYFYDFPKFLTALSSAGPLSIFIMAVSLFALGVIIKRKILAVRLELSKVSFAWGLGLLIAAVLLYVYGSYNSYTVWYHYESLYVLVIAYVALRIGTGVLRTLSPLLAIFAFSFIPIGFFPDLLHQELLVFLSADLIFVMFMTYVGLRVKVAIVPIAMLALGVFGWYTSLRALPFRHIYLDALIPLPLLILLVPPVRRFATLPPGVPSTAYHDHRILLNGFCSVCGLKLSRAKTPENVGLWGLLAILGVAALLLFASIPALAVTGGVPHDVHDTPQGFSGTVTPPTPPGWQINSTAVYNNETAVYSIKQVYVPLFHPETKNYTLYYDLSLINAPVTNGPFGQDLAGWNRSSNVFMQFGPFQGYLTTYVNSNRVMLAYSGRTQMLFLNGTNFEGYFVGMGFVRQFKNPNVNADTSQYLEDLNALWLPSVATDVSYSGWTAFLYTLDQGALLTGPFLLLASSTIAIAWGVYRAGRSDDQLDRFLTVASVQSEERSSYLSRLLKRTNHSATSEELASDAGDPSGPNAERLDTSLRELERIHLVRSLLAERGADVVSVWRTPV